MNDNAVECPDCGTRTPRPSCVVCGRDVTAVTSVSRAPVTATALGTSPTRVATSRPSGPALDRSPSGTDRLAPPSSTTTPRPEVVVTPSAPTRKSRSTLIATLVAIIAALALTLVVVVNGGDSNRDQSMIGADETSGSATSADSDGDGSQENTSGGGIVEEGGGSESEAAEDERFARFEGSDFWISYPTGWKVEDAEVAEPRSPGLLDTTIKPSDGDSTYTVRVDVMRRGQSADALAQDITNGLRRNASFALLRDEAITFSTSDGRSWPARLLEFELSRPDLAYRVHTVDIIFVDGGRTFALLTRSPDFAWGRWAATYGDIWASLRPS